MYRSSTVELSMHARKAFLANLNIFWTSGLAEVQTLTTFAHETRLIDCNFLCQECIKTHLRQYVIAKKFPGVIPPDPR